MTQCPLVSISCLTYNHAPYLRQCLDGFVMQITSFPIEILIYDDASGDGTQNIIEEYQKKYPDIIKPIYQTENQYSKGVKVGFVYNYSRAKGEYIAFCEGDDYWTDPYKLQKQIDFLECYSDYVICSHRYRICLKEEKVMNDEIKALIEHDRNELSGEFCRGCGYCMPCPAGIEINNCARMSLMLRRAPSDAQLTPEMQAKMKKIENCLHCNKCKSKCPYGLDTPTLLQKNYEDYKRVLAGEVSVK